MIFVRNNGKIQKKVGDSSFSEGLYLRKSRS